MHVTKRVHVDWLIDWVSEWISELVSEAEADREHTEALHHIHRSITPKFVTPTDKPDAYGER